MPSFRPKKEASFHKLVWDGFLSVLVVVELELHGLDSWGGCAIANFVKPAASNGGWPACPHAEDRSMALAYSRHLERHPIRAIFYLLHTQVLVAALVNMRATARLLPPLGIILARNMVAHPNQSARAHDAVARENSLAVVVVVSTAHDRCPPGLRL